MFDMDVERSRDLDEAMIDEQDQVETVCVDHRPRIAVSRKGALNIMFGGTYILGPFTEERKRVAFNKDVDTLNVGGSLSILISKNSNALSAIASHNG